MKKSLLYITAALIAALSCSKEQPVPVQNENLQGDVAISLTATLEETTKATVGKPDGSNRCKTTWDANDQIAVHTKGGRLVVLTTNSGGSSAVFSGTIPSGDEVEDGAIAYYPASIAISGNANEVNLPDSYSSAAQAAKGITLRGAVNKDGSSIKFCHLGSLLKITATKVPDSVTSVVLNATGICGNLPVYSSSGQEFIAQGSSLSSISIANSSSERSNGTVEILFPLPVSALYGFSVDFMAGDEVVYRKSTDKTCALERGLYVSAASFDVHTDDGDECDYFIIGKFCDWNPEGDVIKMYAVPGHSGWYAAKDVDKDLSLGFKFLSKDGASNWQYNYGFDGVKDSHVPPFVFEATYNQSGNNVYTKTSGNYDVYLHPEDGANGKGAVLNAGEPFDAGRIFILDEGFDYRNTDPYYIHVWNSSASYTKWQACLASGRQSVNGVPYIVFNVAVDGDLYIPSGDFNLIFGNTGTGMRWEQRNTSFIFNGSDIGLYLCQKAWSRSDENNSMEEFQSFTNLSAPSIDGLSSNYYLVGDINGENKWNATDYPLVWSCGSLVCEGVKLSAGTHRFKFLYMDVVNWSYFNYGCGETYTDGVGAVNDIVMNGSGNNLTITIEDEGSYDFCLDIFNKKASVIQSK